jgi:hypothetical protein
MPCLTGRGEQGFSLTEKTKKGDGTDGRRRLGVEAVRGPTKNNKGCAFQQKKKVCQLLDFFFGISKSFFLEICQLLDKKKECIYIYILDPLSSTSRLRQA